MTVRSIPFIEWPKGVVAKEPPPDGVYATIRYDLYRSFAGERRPAGVKNPFPWRATIWRFVNGEDVQIYGGSDPASVLDHHKDIATVNLVDLDETLRAELDTMLVKQGIKLDPQLPTY